MANEDPRYSRWIRLQPCANCSRPPPSEQHHKSGAGMGLRAHDHDSMPLCRECHHDRLGRMTKEERREFEDRAVHVYHGRYLRHLLENEPPDEESF